MLCLSLWLFLFWSGGAHLDYRSDADGGFIALRFVGQAGVSWQWSATGYSLWQWAGDDNRRLWPPE